MRVGDREERLERAHRHRGAGRRDVDRNSDDAWKRDVDRERDDAWKRNVDPRRDDASTGRDDQVLPPPRRDGRGG
jgi:hypothetical protein